MKVLVVGSGGREHAIAWKISQSPRLTRLYIAPGNAGMADLGMLAPLAVEDSAGILAFAQREGIDLVVIGPEAALAAGVSDVLRACGIAVFGPSQAAAQIETSKRFSKQFMQRHHIPTASFAAFSNYQEACNYLRTVTHPMVIKASGLAAGKGVFLPETLEEGLSVLREIMVDLQFGAAGEEVIIEERLEGEEVSLLAFCDGKTLAVMPPAQDHKRLLDGDEGPNTGGMGAYAPAPALSINQIDEITRTILQPAVDGLRAEGLPLRGRAVCRFDADPGRPESAGVQCPLWRPGNPGDPAAAGKRSAGNLHRLHPRRAGSSENSVGRPAPRFAWCWLRRDTRSDPAHRFSHPRAGCGACGRHGLPRRDAA